MRKPKDLYMGEVAYVSFHQRPQVQFEDLNFDAQMKWVTLARVVVEEWKRSARGEQREKWREQKAVQKEKLNGGGDHRVSKKARKGFIIKSVEEKVRDWDAADAKDVKLLTDNKRDGWKPDEFNARARMAYREAERKKLGLKPKHAELMLR